MFKYQFLRNIFFISLVIMLTLPVYVRFFIYPSFKDSLIQSTEENAIRSANHLSRLMSKDFFEFTKVGKISESFKKEVDIAVADFYLMKIKFFSPTGKIIFSTDSEDIGKINREPYFHETINTGQIITKIVKKGGFSLENEKIMLDVIETYVPVKQGEKYIGAFEIYYDITAQKTKLDDLLLKSSIVLLSVTLGLLAIIIFILNRTAKMLTEREAVERAIAENESKLKTITGAVTDAIIMMDEKGKTCFWNQAAKNIFGYSAQEVLGKDLHEFIAPERFRDSFRTKFQAFCQTGHGSIIGKKIEIQGLKKGGIEFSAEISIASVKIADHWHAVGIVRDISAQKDAREKLALAKKNAETANQAKSVFLANMSHELRTPLNGILGYAQILTRDKSLNSKHKECVKIMQRSGEHLLTLINDVLDLSKIEAGKFELVPNDFAFSEFLNDVVNLLKMRAEEKGIHFDYDQIPPPSSLVETGTEKFPAIVHADEKRLRQVLLNLLSNAIKFTENGFVSFRVNYQEDDNSVRFDVEDTGKGIPEEEQENIFKPFQQMAKQSSQIEGTGLGLPITKKLVEMMGGKLNVESLVGVGSLFWFEINLEVVEYKNKMNDDSIDQLIITGFEGHPRKILIIDDTKENRLVLNDLLQMVGFITLEASSGQMGIEKAQSEHPDLILMDLIMPELSGFETTQKIRQTPELKDIPIIAVSAGVFEHQQQDSLKAGCDDFIPKPIEADIVLNTLKKHLDLEWKYDIVVEKKDNDKEKNADIISVGPPPKIAQELYELAIIGDIEGVIEKAVELKNMGNEFVPFASKLQALAEEFQTYQLPLLIKPYLHEK